MPPLASYMHTVCSACVKLCQGACMLVIMGGPEVTGWPCSCQCLQRQQRAANAPSIDLQGMI